jgi:(4S)-4-hydroxy-5-phosphonooxypentane-2,3-dione isomerase
MLVLLVNIKVKSERVEDFKRATVDNASNSLKEPGVARFDFCQSAEDPTRFIIYEAYRAAEDHAQHRETAHYRRWKAAVEPMMAEQRTGQKFSNVFPSDSGW